jgi:hypothetical protein
MSMIPSRSHVIIIQFCGLYLFYDIFNLVFNIFGNQYAEYRLTLARSSWSRALVTGNCYKGNKYLPRAMNRQSPNSTPIDHRIIYTLVVQLTHHIQMLLLKCFFSLIITMAPFFFDLPNLQSRANGCTWLSVLTTVISCSALYCRFRNWDRLHH